MNPHYVFMVTLITRLATSHSWVERLNRVEQCACDSGCDAVNGPFKLTLNRASGYPRNYIPRTDPNFSDARMTHQLPVEGQSAFRGDDGICSSAQNSAAQSQGNPRLNAAPGTVIALQYNENGHITKPWNNPPGHTSPGEVYVYGTSDSRPSDMLLDIHKVWTTDGSGGDGKGRLIFHGPFDDRKCYQYSDASSGISSIELDRAHNWPPPKDDAAQGMNVWCEVAFELPTDLQIGSVYTLYWIWDWPLESPTYQPLMYTSCMDINIVADRQQYSGSMCPFH